MARISGTRRDDDISTARFISDGEPEPDRPRPTSSDDEVYGGDGNDSIDAGGGRDAVFGGEDNDLLTGGGGDSLYGGEGNDELLAQGIATLFGGLGDDWLRRTAPATGPVTFTGGDGNDLIEAGDSRNDSLFGGEGDDTIAVGTTTGSLIDGGLGTDIIILAEGGIDLTTGEGLGAAIGADLRNFEGAILRRGGGELRGNDGANLLQVEGDRPGSRLTGAGGDDTLRGNDGADVLQGGSGRDILYGRGGDDALYAVGQPGGREAAYGGTGDDRIFIGPAGAVVAGGAGTDRVHVISPAGHVAVDLSLAGRGFFLTGIEILVTGSGDDRVTGGMGVARIEAGAGNDTLTGGSGAERLVGSTGHDRLTGGTGDALYGGDGDDSLIGGTDLALLDGGQGHDTLDLSLVGGGVALDLATGFTSAGPVMAEFEAVLAGAGDDAIAGGTDANTLSGGKGHDILQGRGGRDALAGDAGRDSLDGGQAADTLTGGAGQDRLTGGDGADLFVFRTGDSGPTAGTADRITDFDPASDRIDLSRLDARADLAGDQPFRFGHAGAGGIALSDAGGDTVLSLNTDTDGEPEMVIVLTDGPAGPAAYAADDFIL
jgi:Ca2+-binding RTX toxin-like protein